MKYRPDFPDFFGSLEDARAWVRPFIDWYNNEHYHSSLELLTPATVHYGQAAALLEKRQGVLDAAYAAHPERFVKKLPPCSHYLMPCGLTVRSHCWKRALSFLLESKFFTEVSQSDWHIPMFRNAGKKAIPTATLMTRRDVAPTRGAVTAHTGMIAPRLWGLPGARAGNAACG